jgi:hypothetical protein
VYAGTVIVLVVIVVSFVGSPVVSNLMGPSSVVFGTFKGRPIEYTPGNFFSEQVERIAENKRRAGEDGGANIEAQVRRIWQEAFTLSVVHTAITAIMQDSGAHVSENALDEALVFHPGYLEGGVFSEARYNKTPSSQRLVVRGATRANVLYARYLQDFLSQKRPKAEAEFIKSLASPERNFRFVSFPVEEYPEALVAEYGKENAEKFSQAKLSVITVISSREEAEKIRSEAAKPGASFEDLAATHSVDSFSQQGGELGWRYFYELAGFGRSDEDIRAVFALKPGEVSSAIEGPGSAEGGSAAFSIFRCEEAVREPDFSQADLIAAVRLYMSSMEAGRIQDYMLGEAKTFAEKARASSFLSAALSSGKTAGETGFFPVNYGDSELFASPARGNPVLADAMYREAFFSSVFSLAAGEVSEPVVLRGAVIVFQLLSEREAEPMAGMLLDYYLPRSMLQSQEESLQRFIFDSGDFTDSFGAGFGQFFQFSG